MEHEFWHERWAKDQIGFHEGTVNQYLHDHWPELAGNGTDAVFVKAVNTTSNGSYSLQNTNSAAVHIELKDHVGFMKDIVNVGTKAALISTTITPLTTNPSGYDDRTNQMIQQRWRLLEPQ